MGVVITCRVLWCGCCNNLGCYGVGVGITWGVAVGVL